MGLKIEPQIERFFFVLRLSEERAWGISGCRDVGSISGSAWRFFQTLLYFPYFLEQAGGRTSNYYCVWGFG